MVMLDSFTQPVDRGPSVAEAKRIMRTWQYAVTGKVSVAAALSELKVDHIKHGEERAWITVFRMRPHLPH